MKKGEKKGKKLEETGRNGETEEKTRPIVKTNDLPLFYFVGASQNGGDHIMRTKKRELTNQNGLGVLGPVRTEVITL